MDLFAERIPVSREKGLSTFDLKFIASVLMLVDHIGAYLFPTELWIRYIGRLSFPLFCFLIVEGYLRSKNVYKYMLRLGIFAIISEIPYDLACSDTLFYWQKQNVYITLLAGLVCIWALDRFRVKWQSPIIIIAVCVATHFSKPDYGVGGVLMILGYYIFYNSMVAKYIFEAICNVFIYTKVLEVVPAAIASGSLINGLNMFFLGTSMIQGYAVFAFVPMSFYSGQKGPDNKVIKYMFYAFYPLHHLALFFVRRYLM